MSRVLSPLYSISITNYELAGSFISTNNKPRIQKCRLSAISSPGPFRETRMKLKRTGSIVSPAHRDPLSRDFAWRDTLSRELTKVCRLVYPGISSSLSYPVCCLQLSSHDMPYYRPGDSICRLSSTRAASRENNNRHVIPCMTPRLLPLER